MLYSNSAFGPPLKSIARLSTAIEPNYLFGSRDYKTEPLLYQITNLALTSNVVTATVAIKSGGGATNTLPVVGAKMGVRGVATAAYNVDPTTVVSTTVSNATGTGTITYAKTNANIATAPASGDLVVQSAEVPDIVAAGTASAPFSLVFTPDEDDNSRCLYAEAVWSGTVPTAATVVLQVANVDDEARYATVKNSIGTLAGASVAASDNLAVIAGSAVTQSGSQYSFIMGKFIRAKVLTATGADSTTGLVVTLFA